MRYTKDDIKSIIDDFGKSGAKAYIYVSSYNWFILHWCGVPADVEGFSHDLYTSTSQIPRF